MRRRLRRELVDDRAQERERGIPLVGLRGERDRGIAGVRPLAELDDAALGEMPEQLDEAAEAVGRLAERRILAQDGALQHRREDRATRAAFEPGQRLRDEDTEVGFLRPHRLLRAVRVGCGFGLDVGFGRRPLLARGRPARALRRDRLDAFEALVEEELVARGRQQRRRRRLDADTDHAAIQLAELVDQRREVAVAGAEHERRDVVTLERELDGVDRHLDVGRVLADHAHALRDLDELDVVARELAPILREARPVGVGAAYDDPAPFGERVGDRAKVERARAARFPRADGEVLVVQEQRDAFLVVSGHGGGFTRRRRRDRADRPTCALVPFWPVRSLRATGG